MKWGKYCWKSHRGEGGCSVMIVLFLDVFDQLAVGFFFENEIQNFMQKNRK